MIYRDGVSDGQLAAVAQHELPQIVQTFPKIQPDYEPKLAVVIVKKRGNARFFQQDGQKIQNPQPGTVIDHTVTHVNDLKIHQYSLIDRSSVFFRLNGMISI